MAVLTLGFQDKTLWFWNGIINYFLYFWVGKIDFIIIFFYVHTPHDVTLFILLSWLIRLGLFFSISMSKLVGKSCIDSLSVLKPIHCRSPFFFLVKDQFFVSMFHIDTFLADEEMSKELLCREKSDCTGFLFIYLFLRKEKREINILDSRH